MKMYTAFATNNFEQSKANISEMNIIKGTVKQFATLKGARTYAAKKNAQFSTQCFMQEWVVFDAVQKCLFFPKLAA